MLSSVQHEKSFITSRPGAHHFSGLRDSSTQRVKSVNYFDTL